MSKSCHETYPPDDYPAECAWLQPAELRRRNRELAKTGRRICRTHQGHALPLDAKHFYKRSNGGFENQCIECRRAQNRASYKLRYDTDEKFRRAVIQRSLDHHARHQEAHRRRQARYWREHRLRRFSAVLERAS